MNGVLAFIIGILQITLLDFTLSGDNIGVIALATRNLPDKFANKARLVGVAAAILLRITFACGVTYILSIQWLPVKLIGGLLLIKITWDFIKPLKNEENEAREVKAVNQFWNAVLIIIIADVSMSLDNVLAIAAAADGRLLLIVFGILLNIPIIFFGSEFVANLMEKHKIVVYIGGAILAHTSFKMLLEDRIITGHLPGGVTLIFPWVMAVVVLIYGYYLIKKESEILKEELVDIGASQMEKEIATTKEDMNKNKPS